MYHQAEIEDKLSSIPQSYLMALREVARNGSSQEN